MPTTRRSISRRSTRPGRQGIATTDLAIPATDLKPLFDAILKHVPPPGRRDGRAAADAGHHARLERLRRPHRHRPGRSPARSARASAIALLKHDGKRIDNTIKQLYVFDRLGRIEADEVGAGDICAVVGLEDVDIGDTIADLDNPVALPPITVDEPTLDMIFRINDSPFAGQEGTYVTSRQLRDRLMKELESNVALRVRAQRGEARRVPRLGPRPAAPVDPDREHAPRGLRAVGRQAARSSIARMDGQTLEPIEYLVVDVPTANVGPVMELVGNRRAECVKLDTRGETATSSSPSRPAG